MTFAARPHTGSSGPTLGVQSFGNVGISGTADTSTNDTASLTFNPDGTLTVVNTCNLSESTSVPANWYLPTTGAIGAGYRVEFTLVSGNAWNSGLVSGTRYSLDVARTITWTLIASESRNAQVLIEITTTASTAVIGGGTLYLDLLSEY